MNLSRKEKPKRSFEEDFLPVVEEMDSARKILDELSVEQEFTMKDIDAIDDLRYSAMLLTDIAKTFLEEFEGKKNEDK